MGNTPSRDGGTADPTGGTDCAHPTVGGADNAEGATTSDQYANRHNPFIYFHSIIDNQALCNANEVPLGTLESNGTPSPTGHLVSDLSSIDTTPMFGFVTPNTCDDGHDNPCVGLNDDGTHAGGLVAIDAWLQHWMPTILNSPAYRSGSMLVVLTFDESETAAGDPPSNSSCCYEQPGPNTAAPGDVRRRRSPTRHQVEARSGRSCSTAGTSLPVARTPPARTTTIRPSAATRICSV